MRIEHIVFLAYFGIALVLAMCFFVYYCKQYKKECTEGKTCLKFEYWMDANKCAVLFGCSLFFPFAFLALVLALPFLVIKRIMRVR